MKALKAFCLPILLLALLALWGCGTVSGGGGNPAGSLQVNLDYGDRYVPSGTVSFLIKILSPTTGSPLIADTTLNYPQTSILISNIPAGPCNIVIFANASVSTGAAPSVEAYGTASATVTEGGSSSKTVYLVPGNGKWLMLQPTLTASPYRSGGIYAQSRVWGVVVSPSRFSGTQCTLTAPHQSGLPMTDSGPGGSVTTLQYSYGDSDKLAGVSFLGRGTGSFFEKTLSLAPGSEVGSYGFTINNIPLTMNNDYNYPQIPVINSPLPSAFVDLTSNLPVSWQDLGSGYGYLVEAFHVYSASSGAQVYDYYWSNVDIRTVNYNDPRTLEALAGLLPDSNNALIPGGTFPSELTNLVLQVTAVPKNQVQTELGGLYSHAIFPSAIFAIQLNPFIVGPYISGIYPDSAAPGDQLTIAGSNFGSSQGSSSISLGGADVGFADSWGDTYITCKVPFTAQNGYVVIMVQGIDSNPYPITIGGPKNEKKNKR